MVGIAFDLGYDNPIIIMATIEDLAVHSLLGNVNDVLLRWGEKQLGFVPTTFLKSASDNERLCGWRWNGDTVSADHASDVSTIP